MNDRIKEIIKLIEDLTKDLLVPIRTSKTINEKITLEFYKLLDELVEINKGQELISRKLTGLLFFIYTSIAAEAKYTDYTSPVFMANAKIEDYLDKIFWESPFSRGTI